MVTSDRIIVYDNLGHSITPPAGQGAHVSPADAASLPAWSFDGSTQTTVTNSLPAGSPVAGITFNADAGAFVLNGNPVELSGNVVNQSPSTQTINLPLTLIGGSQTINTAAGDVTSSRAASARAGRDWGITKTGTGTLVLSGANSYSGCTTVLAGVLQVDSANALPDGGNLMVGGSMSMFGSGQYAAAGLSTAGLAATGAESAALLPTGSQASPVLATVVVSSPLIVGTSNADPVLPAKMLGNKAAAVVQGSDNRSRQVAFQSRRGLGNNAAVAVNRAQAHDAVFQSFAERTSIKTKGAAAILDLAGNWSGGQSDQKHDSIARAVDAVMAMLKKM